MRFPARALTGVLATGALCRACDRCCGAEPTLEELQEQINRVPDPSTAPRTNKPVPTVAPDEGPAAETPRGGGRAGVRADPGPHTWADAGDDAGAGVCVSPDQAPDAGGPKRRVRKSRRRRPSRRPRLPRRPRRRDAGCDRAFPRRPRTPTDASTPSRATAHRAQRRPARTLRGSHERCADGSAASARGWAPCERRGTPPRVVAVRRGRDSARPEERSYVIRRR